MEVTTSSIPGYNLPNIVIPTEIRTASINIGGNGRDQAYTLSTNLQQSSGIQSSGNEETLYEADALTKKIIKLISGNEFLSGKHKEDLIARIAYITGTVDSVEEQVEEFEKLLNFTDKLVELNIEYASEKQKVAVGVGIEEKYGEVDQNILSEFDLIKTNPKEDFIKFNEEFDALLKEHFTLNSYETEHDFKSLSEFINLGILNDLNRESYEKFGVDRGLEIFVEQRTLLDEFIDEIEANQEDESLDITA